MKKILTILLVFATFYSYAEERIVLTPEQELWTESFGELKEDNAVLFIHGCGAHAYTWNDDLLQHFIEAGYFVIRYDQRNIGLSGPAYGNFDMNDLAADAITILDDYGIDKVHLVGHSMGGMVAQFVAANYPHRLCSLTLISTAPVGMTPALEKPLSWDELKLSAQAAAYLSAPFPEDFKRALPLYLWGLEFFNGDYPVDQEMAYDYVYKQYFRTRHPFAEGNSKQAAVVFELMRTLEERADIFHCIDTPALIIHGKKDALILVSRGGVALDSALQDSTLKVFPKMGHTFFNKGLIAEMCETMLDFMAQHRETLPL